MNNLSPCRGRRRKYSRRTEYGMVQTEVTAQGWLGSTPGVRRPQIRGWLPGGSLAVASSTPATHLLSPAKTRKLNHTRNSCRFSRPSERGVRSGAEKRHEFPSCARCRQGAEKRHEFRSTWPHDEMQTEAMVEPREGRSRASRSSCVYSPRRPPSLADGEGFFFHVFNFLFVLFQPLHSA